MRVRFGLRVGVELGVWLNVREEVWLGLHVGVY